jgi:hypothetical protein
MKDLQWVQWLVELSADPKVRCLGAWLVWKKAVWMAVMWVVWWGVLSVAATDD